MAGAAVPIVHEKVASILRRLAPNDVQLIPVNVESQPDEYCALNTLRVVRCIDDAACEEVQYWSDEDGQPELVGEYRVVAGLHIDPTKVDDAKIFRPWGWPVVLLVSEEVKTAFEEAGLSGSKFTDVTGPERVHQKESYKELTHEKLMHQVDAARETAFRSLGELEAEALVPIAMGGPLWPGHRQAWRTIHRSGSHTLLATDGMSDPFIDRREPSAGFGLELVIETDEPVEPVAGSWPLRLLQRVADEVAEHERVQWLLLKGLMSMEVSGENMPEALVTDEGRVAVLLGLESKGIPRGFITPAGEVRLVTVKALLPAELTYLLDYGRGGDSALATLFTENGQEHICRATRQPVV